jgi:hypothetical protein
VLARQVRGSNAPLNVVRTIFKALQSQLRVQDLAAMRGKSVLHYTSPDAVPTVLVRNPSRKSAAVRGLSARGAGLHGWLTGASRLIFLFLFVLLVGWWLVGRAGRRRAAQ